MFKYRKKTIQNCNYDEVMSKKPAEQRASFVRKSFHIFSNTHDTSFMVTVT